MSRFRAFGIPYALLFAATALPAQSLLQTQSDAEATWRARRTTQLACASQRTPSSDPSVGQVVTVSRQDCRRTGMPALAAYVLTDHLICPSDKPWMDPNPLALLNPARIAKIEVRRDDTAKARWACPMPVDAVVLVTAKLNVGG